MDENRGLTMREILFRGKWKNSGEWVYGNLFNPDKADTPTQICIGTYIAKTCYEIDPETVGQYTGLTDKNGVKIFEGDILGGYLDDNYPENQTVMEVVWCNYWWGTKEIGCDPDPLEWEDGEMLEIIGNIHDNPELMKGGNNNG